MADSLPIRSAADARQVSLLRALARGCLEENDRALKVSRSLAVAEALESRRLPALAAASDLVTEAGVLPVAGLPPHLKIAAPTKMARRRLTTPGGLAAFVHAIAHIEWNAINLAWDAVWRFDGMPAAYYREWTKVAAEEAKHFSLLRERLHELGYDYGDFAAHGGLWEMAERTADDVLARMALVPRVLEARGLDVTPAMITRLRGAGDEATASILDIILREEVGHVAVGSRWFHSLCRQRGLEPVAAFETALRERFRGRVKAPVSRELRKQAGFTDAELEALDRLAATQAEPAAQP